MLRNILRNAIGRSRSVSTPDEVRALIVRGRLDDAAAAVSHLHPDTPARERVQMCLEAEIAFRQGRDAEAERRFRAVLQEDPSQPDAHYGLSLLLFEKNEGESALRHAQFACSANPQEGRFLAQLGLCHVNLGNYPVAEGLLRSALRALPEDKTCWNNMGIVQAAKGNVAYARQCFNKAVALDPQFRNARENLVLLEEQQAQAPAAAHAIESPRAPEELAAVNPAVDQREAEKPAWAERMQEKPEWDAAWHDIIGLHRQERFDEAMNAAEDLAGRHADDPRLAVELAKLYTAQGDVQGGIDSLLAFLKQHPDEPLALVALGRTYTSVTDFKPAEPCLRKAVRLAPDDWDAHGALGEMLHLSMRYAEASEEAQRAVDLAPTRRPRLIAQLAASQVMACRYDEGLATYDELFALKPMKGNPALGGYSLALAYKGRFEESEAILNELLAFNPNEPGLRIQRAQLRLLHERYAEGWDDYLYRGLAHTKFFRVLPFPMWEGEPLEGRTIVVLAEQGLGDQVMFASCLPDLLALNPKKVHVEAITRVAPTLARSFAQCHVIPSNQNRNLEWVKDAWGADCYVPLADLPARFRRSREAFPQLPFLKADPARVDYWKSELAKRGPAPYIGLSWRGGVELTRKVLRSFAPDTLYPLVQDIPATWINLQYGDVAADLETARAAGMEIHHWPEAIKDLDEFAALITALDAVVTVCNTTVHYAGAIGRKVWVIAPDIPEWRYGLRFERMPWYADVTVLRQRVHGDWSEPVARAARELAAWLGERH
ncbi:MAG TPA: tetratricopeptide repeat protein [Ramlibacter sp.]|uniref:tetratricopeptide repeat protein n=1 Tax=Ramlibacter sp. TaxID=1917967 RepID=UPI002BA65402|nr:tetratricopeptide repeat protein [Ramlibacter sp.]HVZ47048.1 tetratricopeptide repeat protein [Ramlibacter sp.]